MSASSLHWSEGIFSMEAARKLLRVLTLVSAGVAALVFP